MAGNNDPNPHHAEDHQSDGSPAQRLRVDGVRQQVLTINGCINAKG